MQIRQLRGKGAPKIPKKCSDLTKEHAIRKIASGAAKRYPIIKSLERYFNILNHLRFL